jgi:type II secretory pathway component PulC
MPPAARVEADPAARPAAARKGLPTGLSLYGVIPASKEGPGIALLKEAKQPVVLVSEGHDYNADLSVAQIQPDQVVLRRRGESEPYVLRVAATMAEVDSADAR